MRTTTNHARKTRAEGQAGGGWKLRADALDDGCRCDASQHYRYRWDAVNRLASAQRFDRHFGGTWQRGAHQHYLYDSANQRRVKAVVAASGAQRMSLTVLPGDMERRGLSVGSLGDRYEPAQGGQTETQYLVAGARIVCQDAPPVLGEFRAGHRITVALQNLIQSTSAVVDLQSGALLETATYYPNGARESWRAAEGEPLVNGSWALEPAGFTGKEADEEVGLVYFGERYLVPRIGRWATPDPLAVHAVGGGESLNSYHYVAGSLLQVRDPWGLDIATPAVTYEGDAGSVAAPAADQAQLVASDIQSAVLPNEQGYFLASEDGVDATSEGMAAWVVNAVEDSLGDGGALSDTAEGFLDMIMSNEQFNLHPVDRDTLADTVSTFNEAPRREFGEANIKARYEDGREIDLWLGTARDGAIPAEVQGTTKLRDDDARSAATVVKASGAVPRERRIFNAVRSGSDQTSAFYTRTDDQVRNAGVLAHEALGHAATGRIHGMGTSTEAAIKAAQRAAESNASFNQVLQDLDAALESL